MTVLVTAEQLVSGLATWIENGVGADKEGDNKRLKAAMEAKNFFTLTGAVTLSTADITQVLTTSGGAGSAASNGVVNVLLPSQAGNAGKVLSTDGSNVRWVTAATGGGGGVAGVASFNGRAGVVTLEAGDIKTVNSQSLLGSGNITVGDVTLSGTQTLTNKTLSNCTVDGQPIGFRNIPQTSKSADYACVLSDAGGHILHPSTDTAARTFVIPANSTVAYPIGTAITFVNQNGAGVLTIAITLDVMRLAGSGATGNRTLAANGIATALKISSTEWIISGTGLT